MGHQSWGFRIRRWVWDTFSRSLHLAWGCKLEVPNCAISISDQLLWSWRGRRPKNERIFTLSTAELWGTAICCIINFRNFFKDLRIVFESVSFQMKIYLNSHFSKITFFLKFTYFTKFTFFFLNSHFFPKFIFFFQIHIFLLNSHFSPKFTFFSKIQTSQFFPKFTFFSQNSLYFSKITFFFKFHFYKITFSLQNSYSLYFLIHLHFVNSNATFFKISNILILNLKLTKGDILGWCWTKSCDTHYFHLQFTRLFQAEQPMN